MSNLDQYLDAVERDNTRRSYASAIRHFEIEWKGLLPSTSDAISRYLADHAATLAINTLRQRLAALSRWHTDQGFPDPTKSPLVRQVLKGIRSVHTVAEIGGLCAVSYGLHQPVRRLHAGFPAKNRTFELRHDNNSNGIIGLGVFSRFFT